MLTALVHPCFNKMKLQALFEKAMQLNMSTSLQFITEHQQEEKL